MKYFTFILIISHRLWNHSFIESKFSLWRLSIYLWIDNVYKPLENRITDELFGEKENKERIEKIEEEKEGEKEAGKTLSRVERRKLARKKRKKK